MCDRIEHSKVAWGHIGAKLFVVLQHIVHHRALSLSLPVHAYQDFHSFVSTIRLYWRYNRA